MRDRLLDLKAGAPEEVEQAPAPQLPKRKNDKPLDVPPPPDLLKEFFDKIGTIKDNLSGIKNTIEQIENAHQQALNSISDEQSNEKTKALEKLMEKANKQINVIKNTLKAENKQMASKDPDSSDLRIRQSQHSAITKKFLDTLMEYKEVQKKYQDKYKQRMERQIHIVNPNATEEQVKTMVESGETRVFAQQITSQKVEAKRALQDIQDRHADVLKIERSIIELQQLFMDMAVMIAAQGEMLNQVEIQVSNAAADTNKGVDALKDAVKYQKKSRKKICIVLICMVVLALILGAVLGTQLSKKT